MCVCVCVCVHTKAKNHTIHIYRSYITKRSHKLRITLLRYCHIYCLHSLIVIEMESLSLKIVYTKTRKETMKSV